MLECPPSFEHQSDGLPENLQIQQKRVVLDVVQIIFDVQVQGLIAAATDGLPACHALGYGETLALSGLITIECQFFLR